VQGFAAKQPSADLDLLSVDFDSRSGGAEGGAERCLPLGRESWSANCESWSTNFYIMISQAESRSALYRRRGLPFAAAKGCYC